MLMSQKLELKEKIDLLIKAEKITQSRLAEILEIQPAGVSHLLAGRNKPGFDLLQKILRRFPRLNPDWLLLDAEQMYRDQTAEAGAGAPQSNAATPGRQTGEKPAPNFDGLFAGLAGSAAPSSSASPAGASPTQPEKGVSPEAAASGAVAPQPASEVARVIVFYTDHSFESFVPKK